MHLWLGLKTQTPQLQCDLWKVHLLMQSLLGWQHQTQQATCCRLVQINLLHSDMAHIQPGTNSHGGTGTLVCWQIPVHLASGMHGLVCVLVFILYHVCTPFSWDVWCKHFTYSIPCLLGTTHFSIEGNSINVVSMVDIWMGGVDQRLFGLSTAAPPEKSKSPP